MRRLEESGKGWRPRNEMARMTRQVKGPPAPMVLASEYPGESFVGLRLYRILDQRFQVYRFQDFPGPEADKMPTPMSCDWGAKGYAEHLLLREDGRLVLHGYEYELDLCRLMKALPPHEMTVLDQVLEGDFFLDLRASYRSRSWLAPFRSGLFVADRKQWRRKFNWHLLLPGMRS